ncbi:hypothetical protein DFH09DRAFT_1313644 [Mycena vulgaris]|nr:hypothetical protein DFH09DRAFT_1313644 [Mycena vulgaris]
MFAPTIYNKAPYTAYIPSVGDHALVITTMDTVAVDLTDYASLPVLPEIEELKKFIESDSQMYMMFNQMFMDDNRGIYLTTPASANVLTAGKGGGFSKPALAGMMEHFTGLTFEQVFVSYPAAPHYGFTCWNDLFIRKLRPACESQYYNVATNVKERDTFWLDGHSYWLRDMLAHDELVPHFVGGMVYQGYLRVTYYHRRHTPVAVVVKKIIAVPGAYVSQSPVMLQSPIPLDAPFDTLPISNSLSFLP